MRTPLRAIATMIALLFTLAAGPSDGVPSPGTVLSGKIDQTIDSRVADPLEPFTVSDVSADDRSVTRGKVFGHITKVVKADQHAAGAVVLAIDAFITSSGRRIPLEARPVLIVVNTKTGAGKDAFAAVGGIVDGKGLGKMPLGPPSGGAVTALGGSLTAKHRRADVIIPLHATIQMEVVSGP